MDSHAVRWRGQQAEYSTDERQIMQQLTVREQAFVHTLKSFTHGEIQEGRRVKELPDLEREELLPTSGHGLNDGQRQVPAAPVLYTAPEDLEFGKPKRRPRVYALVCTWQQSCVVPTKREGEFWTKVWKAWYEWRGWKVNSHDTGYFAALGTERHSIGLHEYDKETHERIK